MLVPGVCFGQGTTRSFAPGDTAKDKGIEEQIAKMTEEVVAAEVREDAAAMNRFFTENYTHTHAAGKIQTKAEFIADFKPGTHKYKAADISEIRVRSFGTSALVSGHEHIAVEGPNGDHHYSFVAFWVQDQGKWRIAAWVTSVDPKHLRVDSRSAAPFPGDQRDR
jgi:ketosteroid isomerase-like protein